jgi:hypothetical protein
MSGAPALAQTLSVLGIGALMVLAGMSKRRLELRAPRRHDPPHRRRRRRRRRL